MSGFIVIEFLLIQGVPWVGWGWVGVKWEFGDDVGMTGMMWG